jgi:hypothetical protein
MKILIVVLVVLVNSVVFSQTNISAGIIAPDFEKLTDLPKENYSYVPGVRISLYDKPEGNVTADLSRFCPVAKYVDGNMRMFILPLENENNCIHITTADLHNLGNETYAIKFTARDGDYVLINAQDSKIQYWAKISDFEKADYLIKAAE